MATDFVTIVGESMWAKVFIPDEYGGVKTYKVNLVVDDENFEKFKASGIRTKTKEYEGRPMILVKRPAEGRKMPNGTMLGGGIPEVVDEAGNSWTDGVLGNGSVVEVKVAVYDTKNFGKGHRLERIRVLKHVPYESEKREVAEEPVDDRPIEKKKKDKIPF